MLRHCSIQLKFRIMIQQHKEKPYFIECYVSGLLGHAIPLAKTIEILQNRFKGSTIILVTLQLVKHDIQKMFKDVQIVGQEPKLTREDWKVLIESPPQIMFNNLFSQFQGYLKEKKSFPDLIIADIFAVAAMDFAKKNKIPLLVNFPNSYNTIHNLFNFLSLDRSVNIEGFLVNCPLPKLEMMFPFDRIMDVVRGYGRILFHSFTGLDEPSLMPPNHTLVGLMPNRSSSQLTPELKGWVDGWKSKGKDKFLYVSFGSILKLSQNFALKLARLFTRLGYPTIWSLRAPFASEINDPLIFHQPWLPQEAILRLPQVKGYMTHCGWGSITEAITTETPLLCVPAFADQPENAKLVVKRHIGIQVYQTLNFKVPDQHQIELSQERVKTAVTEIMEDETYQLSIRRLNELSKLHNSTDNVCRVVEEALRFGNSHLINPIYEAATIKTGQPLSKIIVKEFLPQNIA